MGKAVEVIDALLFVLSLVPLAVFLVMGFAARYSYSRRDSEAGVSGTPMARVHPAVAAALREIGPERLFNEQISLRWAFAALLHAAWEGWGPYVVDSSKVGTGSLEFARSPMNPTDDVDAFALGLIFPRGVCTISNSQIQARISRPGVLNEEWEAARSSFVDSLESRISSEGLVEGDSVEPKRSVPRPLYWVVSLIAGFVALIALGMVAGILVMVATGIAGECAGTRQAARSPKGVQAVKLLERDADYVVSCLAARSPLEGDPGTLAWQLMAYVAMNLRNARNPAQLYALLPPLGEAGYERVRSWFMPLAADGRSVIEVLFCAMDFARSVEDDSGSA